ncbi:MAG: hypothetical protein V3R93_01145, partial [Candidatus Hydrothermarchaeaceae archaeon]
MKKFLGLLILLIIALPLAFGWTTGTYIKNDANKLYSLTNVPQYNLPIRVDANGDGDINDEIDYVLYNELYVLDGYRKAEVRLVYSLDPPSTITPDMQDFVGTVVEIRGVRYLITAADWGTVTMGEPIEVTLHKQEKFDPTAGRTVVGDIKFELADTTLDVNKMGVLYIMKGESVLGAIDLDREHSSGQFPNNAEMSSYIKDVTEELEGYRIFLIDAKPRNTKFALVKNDELFDIRDGGKGVLGYDEVRINDDEFGTGSNKGTGRIKFLSRRYTIEKDGETKVEDNTPYRLQFSDRNKFRIIRYSFPVTNETIKAQKANESARISTAWRGESIKSYSDKILVLGDYGPAFIKVDGNGDGNIRDAEDYTQYNQLYVLSGTPKAEVRLIYNLEPPRLSAFLSGSFENLLGMTLDIKDKKYLVTLAEENRITLGEGPIEKTLRKQESPDPGAAVRFVDDIGMLRVGNPDRPSALGTLYIYKGGALVGSIELSVDRRDISYAISEAADVLEDYTVILSNTSTEYTKIAIVKSKNLKTIMDESADIFGYEKVYVNNDEFPEGRDRVKFLSRLYTIEKDNETLLDDNPVYTLKYNLYGEFRVKTGRFPKKVNETNQTNATLPETTPPETPPPIIEGTGGTLLEMVLDEQGDFNTYMETSNIPGVLRGLASGRYIVHVNGETVGIVVESGMITGVRDGGIEDPTSEVWTSREYFDKVLASDGAMGLVVAGLNNGEIIKKDYGLGGKIKGRTGLVGMRLMDVLRPAKVILTEEEASGSVRELTKSVVNGTYAMNPATSTLRRTHIEMGSPENKDIGGEEIRVREYAGYKAGKAPKGLNKWESVDGETSLGTFVDIEKSVDVDWALVFIKYTRKEIEERDLTEGSLYIKWHNDDPDSDTYGQWITLMEGNPSWVNSVAIDKENEGVWVNVSHFSVYGVGGIIRGPPGSVYGVQGHVIGPP